LRILRACSFSGWSLRISSQWARTCSSRFSFSSN